MIKPVNLTAGRNVGGRLFGACARKSANQTNRAAKNGIGASQYAWFPTLRLKAHTSQTEPPITVKASSPAHRIKTSISESSSLLQPRTQSHKILNFAQTARSRDRAGHIR